MRLLRRRTRPAPAPFVDPLAPSLMTAAMITQGYVFIPGEHAPVPRPDGKGYLQARSAVAVRLRQSKTSGMRLRWAELGVEVVTPNGWILLVSDELGRERWPDELLELWPPCWCLGTGWMTDGTACPECPNGHD